MNYKFIPMKRKYADEIAYEWKYDGIYSFYDMTADEEDLIDFLNEENWDKAYYAVLNEKDKLIGFYLFSFEEDIMWLGFGLHPELTGKGIGYEFVNSGINFGINEFNYKKDYIMLAVALFNKRAIKLYEKIGFIHINNYMQKTNGGEFEFVNMKKLVPGTGERRERL